MGLYFVAVNSINGNMNKYIYIFFFLQGIPVFASNGTGGDSVFALGGISFLFLCFFLYLISDYTSLVVEKETENAESAPVQGLEVFQNEKFRPVLRQTVYKSVAENFSDPELFGEGSEFVMDLGDDLPIRIYRNGSVFVISSHKTELSAAQKSSLASGLIAKTDTGVYFPVKISGYFSWLFIAAIHTEKEIANYWDLACVLAKRIDANLVELLQQIDKNTGLPSRTVFMQSLEEEFHISNSRYLTFFQIHGGRDEFLQVTAVIQEYFKNLCIVEGHTIGIFQSHKEVESMKILLPELILRIRELNLETSISVASSLKKGDSSGKWLLDAENALRHACINGPDYFYQQ